MSSTQRFASLDDYPRRRHQGRWLCRWCGVPCPGRRTSYCSDPCAREVAIRTTNTGLRYYTFERDGGHCTDCQLDAAWLRTELRKLRKQDHARWMVQIRALGFTRREALRSLWEADHILPVNAGGGACGLINIATRCTRCHKAKTARERMTTAVKKLKKKVRKKAKPPKPKAKPTKFRERGLFLSSVSVKVEDVKKAHSTACIDCKKLPTTRRLKVQKGSARSALSEVYCIDCGEVFLNRVATEAGRAINLLESGGIEKPGCGAIRVADEQFERVKAEHKRRAEERKRKKAEKEAQALAS